MIKMQNTSQQTQIEEDTIRFSKKPYALFVDHNI